MRPGHSWGGSHNTQPQGVLAHSHEGPWSPSTGISPWGTGRPPGRRKVSSQDRAGTPGAGVWETGHSPAGSPTPRWRGASARLSPHLPLPARSPFHVHPHLLVLRAGWLQTDQ